MPHEIVDSLKTGEGVETSKPLNDTQKNTGISNFRFSLK
jgi:hypothetical protein